MRSERTAILALAVAAACASSAASASTEVVGLSFEGLVGKDGAPVDLKTAYASKGIAFSEGAIALRALVANGGVGLGGSFGDGSVKDQGTPDPLDDVDYGRYLETKNGARLSLGDSAMLLQESDVYVDFKPGFSTGFSFYYSTTKDVSVRVYDASGEELSRSTFKASESTLCSQSDNAFCLWRMASVDLGSKIAARVRISGTKGLTVLDNITFGSIAPLLFDPPVVAIPEPATYGLMALGLAGLAVAVRRRRRQG